VKFLKARELAELEAKKHIEKLNGLLKKREEKEKKMQELMNESSLERLMNVQRANQKRDTAKSKIEKIRRE